jgi:hypothetical protein
MENYITFNKNTKANNTVKIRCISCKQKTNHTIISNYEETQVDEEFNYWIIDYQIVKCNGCNDISFRKISSDPNQCIPIYYGDNEVDYEPIEYEDLYPPRHIDRDPLKDNDLFQYTPEKIADIYTETNKSINNKLTILSPIGLRALMEAICNDLIAAEVMPDNIRNLKEKIDFLVKKGYLQEISKDILHRIRTIGNESAHECEEQKMDEISLAMEVIEALIKSLYIHPKRFNKISKRLGNPGTLDS